MMEYPASELPPEVSFGGAGVYTIHYRGTFAPYAGMREEKPIYVGKAEIRGKRQGRAVKTRPSVDLYKRLSEHAASIEAARNLDIRDFRCRWLVLDSIWIGLTEQVLIAEHRPIWNAVVGGFGNHDPGGGRRNQKRSQWDTLHPGRKWATLLRNNDLDVEGIMANIAANG